MQLTKVLSLTFLKTFFLLVLISMEKHTTLKIKESSSDKEVMAPFDPLNTIALLQDLKFYVVNGEDKTMSAVMVGCLKLLEEQKDKFLPGLNEFWTKMKQVASGDTDFDPRMVKIIIDELQYQSIQDPASDNKIQCNGIVYKTKVELDKVTETIRGKYFDLLPPKPKGCAKPFIAGVFSHHRGTLLPDSFKVLNQESRNTVCNNSTDSSNSTSPVTKDTDCPSGEWKETTTNECKKCDISCATCAAPLVSDCLTCNLGGGYYPIKDSLLPTTCYLNCPDGSGKDENTKTCPAKQAAASSTTTSTSTSISTSSSSSTVTPTQPASAPTSPPIAATQPSTTTQVITTAPTNSTMTDNSTVSSTTAPADATASAASNTTTTKKRKRFITSRTKSC